MHGGKHVSVPWLAFSIYVANIVDVYTSLPTPPNIVGAAGTVERSVAVATSECVGIAGPGELGIKIFEENTVASLLPNTSPASATLLFRSPSGRASRAAQRLSARCRCTWCRGARTRPGSG